VLVKTFLRITHELLRADVMFHSDVAPQLVATREITLVGAIFEGTLELSGLFAFLFARSGCWAILWRASRGVNTGDY